MEYIIYSDAHYSNNRSKAYTLNNGMSSWLTTQLEITDQIFSYAKEKNIKTIIHNGDLFEDKNRINVNLYNVVWSKYAEYAKDGSDIIFNTGNHDYITLDRVSSLKPFSNIVTVIYKPTVISDEGHTVTTIVPYGMLDKVSKDSKGVFIIHEDINDFTGYNKMGGLHVKDFKDYRLVFNGHIHKPQIIDNVVNIGAIMCHRWTDAGEQMRFIHYKDGKYTSININHPKFITLSGLSERIKSKIKSDNSNFYRIDIESSEIIDPIFKLYNVFPNIVKYKERKVKITEDISLEDELSLYIESQDTHNLDKNKLLEIGILVQKGEKDGSNI